MRWPWQPKPKADPTPLETKVKEIDETLTKSNEELSRKFNELETSLKPPRKFEVGFDFGKDD